MRHEKEREGMALVFHPTYRRAKSMEACFRPENDDEGGGGIVAGIAVRSSSIRRGRAARRLHSRCGALRGRCLARGRGLHVRPGAPGWGRGISGHDDATDVFKPCARYMLAEGLPDIIDRGGHKIMRRDQGRRDRKRRDEKSGGFGVLVGYDARNSVFADIEALRSDGQRGQQRA